MRLELTHPYSEPSVFKTAAAMPIRLTVPQKKNSGGHFREQSPEQMVGAGKETRTLDIFLGKEVLYQLSYTRIKFIYC